MGVTYMRDKGQMTIPSDIRETTHLEKGDPIEVVVVEEGILLRPKKIVDATQAWFWTPAWQESVRRSLEQVEGGEGVKFNSDEDFLQALEGE